MKRSGFSFIEVIVIVGILGVISGVSIPLYNDYQIRSDLNRSIEQVTQGLQRARLLSQSGQNDDGWGFYIPGGILYKGPSYATRDVNYDETYPMPSTITTTGITEIAYAKLNGTPSATGSITLTALNKEQRTVVVTVDEETIPTIQSDWFTICHYPSAENHTMQIPDNAWPAHQSHGDTMGACPGASSSSAASSVAMSSSSSSAGGGDQIGGGCALMLPNGSITTNTQVDLTYRVLGSAITWGEGGPEIAVRVAHKKTTGTGYQKLFSDQDVDGGETHTITAIPAGKEIVARVNGYYKQSFWLTFDQTFYSDDQTGHIVALLDGDPVPDYPVFGDQDDLETFLADIIDENNLIDISPNHAVLLVELGSLNSTSADFQDAVILLEFTGTGC